MTPLAAGVMAGASGGTATVSRRLLNNTSGRVVNHTHPVVKNVNSERERLSAAAAAARYVVRPPDEDDDDSMSDRGAGFGCAGNAFGYSTLNNRKNLEADAHNPNLYSSIDDLKDNRRLENMYDEIQKRASAARGLGKKNTWEIKPNVHFKVASKYVRVRIT